MNLNLQKIDWSLVQQLVFFVFAAVTVGGAVYVLLTKNVLYAIFGLLLTFLGVAGLFVFAGADFLAVTQIMIYVGGILVLLIFGIMLTRKKNELKINGKANEILVEQRNQSWSIGVTLLILLAFMKIIYQANFQLTDKIITGSSRVGKELSYQTTVNKIGVGLMTNYVFAFEVIGILLLIALIGATYIAKKESK